MTQPVFNQATVALSLNGQDAALLQYAALLARSNICHRFCFAHVAAPQGADKDKSAEQLRAELESEVVQYFGAAATPAASFHVGHGALIDSLLQVATESGSDLVLLGHLASHSGRRSLASRLAMLGPKAVWMVPQGTPVAISRILVPVDFSDHAAESLALAGKLARAHGLTECHALHVSFDASSVHYEEHVLEILGNEQRAFEQFVARVPTGGVTIKPIFEDSANVAHAILDEARRHQADLLVMNTRGRSRAAATLLGSVTADTLAETQVPLLVLKSHGAHLTMLQALRENLSGKAPAQKSN